MTENGYVAVREIMVAAPRTVDGLATVADAVAMMREHGISSLVIDRRHENDEYGMVVLADIARHVIAQDRSPERTNVYEIMTKPVLHVNADMDVKYAIRLLDRLGLSRVLVTENESMVGIATLRDMVLHYLGGSRDPGGSRR